MKALSGVFATAITRNQHKSRTPTNLGLTTQWKIQQPLRFLRNSPHKLHLIYSHPSCLPPSKDLPTPHLSSFSQHETTAREKNNKTKYNKQKGM